MHPPLERLAEDLRAANSHFIALAIYGSPAARTTLITQLRALLRGARAVVRVTVSARAPNPLPTAQRAARPDGAPAFFVTGYERLGASVWLAAMSALNIDRGALTRLGGPIVFWFAETQLQRVMRDAPDFFAYRGGIYDLRRGTR